MSEKETPQENEEVESCKDSDKKGKCKELKAQIEELEAALSKTATALEEQTKKANQYLSTASYYKNEVESQKKDFERFKERNKNIETEAIIKANETIAKKLLPILDNFDQAIAHVDSEVMKGFSMIHTSLVNCLTEIGVVEVETEGELNPEFHNCISTEQTEDESLDGKIATIYQKGYKFAESNKVIRPATVSVYKA